MLPELAGTSRESIANGRASRSSPSKGEPLVRVNAVLFMRMELRPNRHSSHARRDEVGRAAKRGEVQTVKGGRQLLVLVLSGMERQ